MVRDSPDASLQPSPRRAAARVALSPEGRGKAGLFAEKLIRRAAELARGVALGLGAGDFGFESLDALVKLGHRQRIEILPHQRSERVIALAWFEIVDVHDPEI
mgnify:CR=1 FL=1